MVTSNPPSIIVVKKNILLMSISRWHFVLKWIFPPPPPTKRGLDSRVFRKPSILSFSVHVCLLLYWCGIKCHHVHSSSKETQQRKLKLPVFWRGVQIRGIWAKLHLNKAPGNNLPSSLVQYGIKGKMLLVKQKWIC